MDINKIQCQPLETLARSNYTEYQYYWARVVGDITQLLNNAEAGNSRADSELFTLVYAELRKLAGTCLRAERPDHTLQPTALVNEAYLRLAGGRAISWQGRAHFFGIAGRVMRRILVEYARQRNAAKRGGGLGRLDLDDSMAFVQRDPARLIEVDQALARLAAVDARAVTVVELRFFAGLSLEEAAETLAVSRKTVQRDWEFARVWLERELRGVRA